MDLQENKSSADYLAPDIKELARQRGGKQNDPLNTPELAADQKASRAVARRLLPACLAAPAVLWWVLVFGQKRGWYDVETTLTLFVFSVTAAFGAIVCINLKKLSRMDAERAEAEAKMKLARDAAEAANRFKSAFFANISHEIRTPLTAINGFAELLLNPKRTQKEKLGDARVIRRNGEHLLTLINDILDLSKIEAGKMSVDRVICSPAALVGEICSMLRPRANDKKLKLDLTFKGSIPKTILTDPTRLRQILINLISNAIKFTQKGSVQVAVSIQPNLAAPKPLLTIKVTDTGIGIPAERIDSLFEPFVQGDASITRQFGGTGLGLTISRHFSRALGGDVTVTSEAGRGSTFTITIETGSLAGVAIQEKPEEATDLQDSGSVPQVRISGSVLVAEDGIDNQALIATRLRQTGLSVEIAPNGKIACEKALAANQAQRPFDIILMDVQMPVMDGFSATLHLRSKGYRGPVIALTANAMERDRDKCLNAGCNEFVTKPINLEKLFKAIGRYLPVEQVADDSSCTDDVVESAQAAPAGTFNEKLAADLAEIEKAAERQDRVRLTELVQLTLGKIAGAGMKDLAAQAARLMQSAEGESSWKVLQHAVTEFAREARATTQTQTA